MKTEIIYEDREILVVYKPAGIATQTAKIGQQDVVSELKNYLAQKGEATYLGVIHRLDQPVEGLLVFGKTKEASANLSGQLTKEGGLHKQYQAVICGKPAEKEDCLVDYLDKNKEGKAYVVSDKERETHRDPAAKKAVLRYQVTATRKLQELSGQENSLQAGIQMISGQENSLQAGLQMPPGQEISLLAVTIETGRYHQIRCQLSHAGYPILGDSKYGDEVSLAISKSCGVKNVALCASEISFLHPGNHKKKTVAITPRGPIFASFSKNERGISFA